jgi:uncharacterized protein (DUF1501 family)
MTPPRDSATANLKECGCPQDQGVTARRGFSRRSFFKRALGAGALTGLASHELSTRMAFAATPYVGDVLVVLSLRGGFDGLNTVVPTSEPKYEQVRPNIHIPQNALIPLDANFGLHPAMQSLVPFWNDGSLGFVQAVGMTNPTRSHFEAMEEMERAAPGTSVRTGWLDRTLGLRDTEGAFQAVQMGSSMASSAFLGNSPELAMWSVDSFDLSGAWDTTERQRWRQALEGLHTNAPDPIAMPAATTLSALSTAGDLQDAGYTPDPAANYPNTGLGRAMRDVARVIKADIGLQVAAVDFGDWDMHVDLGSVDDGWLYDKLTELSGSLAAFATDLGAGMADVTLITMTEFGRSLTENGSGGVDHGHGQAVLMLGGGVNGGVVHGDWPGLANDALVDGDLAGTTDYRQLLAEILEKRCGASVSTIFPNAPAERLGVVRPRV